MSLRYYYRQGVSTYGPVSGEDLRSLAHHGHLRPEDTIQREGDAHWVRAGELKSLFGSPAAGAAAPATFGGPPPIAGGAPYGLPAGPSGLPGGAWRPLPTGTAVAAMVVGILSVVMPCLGFVTGWVAIGLGLSARRSCDRGEAGGRGMATAGVVLGVIAVCLAILGLSVQCLAQLA